MGRDRPRVAAAPACRPGHQQRGDMMRQYLICTGGMKLEAYGRHGRGQEWPIRGMIYEWRGEEVPDPHDPEEMLLVVHRPWLGGPLLAPRSEFIPVSEVAWFFDDG